MRKAADKISNQVPLIFPIQLVQIILRAGVVDDAAKIFLIPQVVLDGFYLPAAARRMGAAQLDGVDVVRVFADNLGRNAVGNLTSESPAPVCTVRVRYSL